MTDSLDPPKTILHKSPSGLVHRYIDSTDVEDTDEDPEDFNCHEALLPASSSAGYLHRNGVGVRPDGDNSLSTSLLPSKTSKCVAATTPIRGLLSRRGSAKSFCGHVNSYQPVNRSVLNSKLRSFHSLDKANLDSRHERLTRSRHGYSIDTHHSSEDKENNENAPLKSASEQIDDNVMEKMSNLGEIEKEENEEEDGEEEQGEQLLYPDYYPKVLFYFTQTTHPRDWCLRLITWQWFERCSMLIILINCITLGMYQPCVDVECLELRCRVLTGFDDFIFAFFAAEMIVKIIAMGFIGKLAYLGDTWNRLDMFIVLAGTLEYIAVHLNISKDLSLTAIRTIRVLRPLRAINRIPSMRILVSLLLDTLPMLGNVLLLCFFVFFIFGIIGVQLWAGVLKQRCFLAANFSYPHFGLNLTEYFKPNQSDIISFEIDFLCALPDSSGMQTCDNIPPSLIWIEDAQKPTSMVCHDKAEPDSLNMPTNQSCVNWNQYYSSCRPEGPNPFMNTISFDNIAYAWVAIFQVISMESWVDIMYYVQDAHSFWDWIYFVSLIVIGSFFMINLCLVVIATQFSETKKRETERMLLERQRYLSTSTLASSYEANSGNSCYSVLIKILSRACRRLKRRICDRFKKRVTAAKKRYRIRPGDKTVRVKKRRKNDSKNNDSVIKSEEHKPLTAETTCDAPLLLSTLENPNSQNILSEEKAPEKLTTSFIRDSKSIDIENCLPPPTPNNLTLPAPILSSSSNCLNKTSLSLNPTPSDERDDLSRQFAGLQVVHSNSNFLQLPGSNSLRSNSITSNDSVFVSREIPVNLPDSHLLYVEDDNSFQVKSAPISRQTSIRSFRSSDKEITPQKKRISIACPPRTNDRKDGCDEYSDEDSSSSSYDDETQDSESEFVKRPPGIFKICRSKVKWFTNHKYFQRGILLAILVNTLSMGIEYHEQPTELTMILEYSNIVFSSLFLMEMLLKLISDGIFGYIKNGFNVFDGIIVILSMVELLQSHSSGLSVLRTFRLLRILKLVRFLPALRRQLVVMLKTIDNVTTFFALLVLFIFIFSILGMSLFGCKFCKIKKQTGVRKCERKNFDSLLWAIVTVFQILTQEDWNTVLYNGMSYTSPWAALYFIALMTFGNYVLFNLLVAILVEGFSSDRSEKGSKSSGSKCDNTCSPHMDDFSCHLSHVSRGSIKCLEDQRKFCEESGTRAANIPPPIITHTAATPMPTPQGSPPDIKNIHREFGNRLCVEASQKNYSTLQSNENVDKSEESDSCEENCLSLPRSITPSEDLMSSKLCVQSLKIPSPWSSNQDSLNNNTEPSSRKSSIASCSILVGGNSPAAQKVRHHSDSVSYTGRHSPRRASISSFGVPQTGSSYPKSALRLSRQSSFNSHRTVTPQSSLEYPALFENDSKYLYDAVKHNSNDISDELHLQYQDKLFMDEKNIKSGSDDQDLFLKLIDRICPKWKPAIVKRYDYVLFIWSPNSKLRKCCACLADNKWFDNVILGFIALNCITLAMERPTIKSASLERQILNTLNYVFTVVFLIELIIKLIAKGLILSEHSYLRSGWNVMDGFLVAISLIDVLITLAGKGNRIFGILRVFRLLRTLRPLRVISRAPGLKLVVQTLLSSLRPIGNIVLICCTFFIIFGILGVQLFKGKFHFCDGRNLTNVVDKETCLMSGNVWKRHQYNFDSLGQALMALFVLSSKDGWVQIMHTGLDAVGVGKQPIENYNEWSLIYFISFLLLVGFFVLNMFVGVVVENFHKCREDQEKEEKAMLAAKRVQRIQKKKAKLMAPPYWANYPHTRRLLNDIIISKYFDLAIALIIGFNVLTMSLEHYQMSDVLTTTLKGFNYLFTLVFIIESILKIIALGFRRYNKERWNQLDMIIVLLSIVGVVLEEMENKIIPVNPTIMRVMRVLRLARVLKLLKMAKGIRELLNTVVQALPQVGNLGLLFFLLFFIFAALGVELFGKLECSTRNRCVGLGRHAHFKNFGIAFLTLFRIATGDNWNGIMKDTLRTKGCDDSENCESNCCVSSVIAPIYFVVFVLMAQFVLVNVVVAVLMKHLEDSHKMMFDEDELEREVLRQIKEESKGNQVPENEVEVIESPTDNSSSFKLDRKVSVKKPKEETISPVYHGRAAPNLKIIGHQNSEDSSGSLKARAGGYHILNIPNKLSLGKTISQSNPILLYHITPNEVKLTSSNLRPAPLPGAKLRLRESKQRWNTIDITNTSNFPQGHRSRRHSARTTVSTTNSNSISTLPHTPVSSQQQSEADIYKKLGAKHKCWNDEDCDSEVAKITDQHRHSLKKHSNLRSVCVPLSPNSRRLVADAFRRASTIDSSPQHHPPLTKSSSLQKHDVPSTRVGHSEKHIHNNKPQLFTIPSGCDVPEDRLSPSPSNAKERRKQFATAGGKKRSVSSTFSEKPGDAEHQSKRLSSSNSPSNTESTLLNPSTTISDGVWNSPTPARRPNQLHLQNSSLHHF